MRNRTAVSVGIVVLRVHNQMLIVDVVLKFSDLCMERLRKARRLGFYYRKGRIKSR